ncbi:methyltransferase [Flavicella sp.]|uniref:methyltransferase n=1 Tax=Flavicella sp. TaxID=2957742 RepID=UPI0026336809|nr:methyltransferase [Flavicella sp.]MDG1803620.1 methyltransferase [Flavicella sp.]
MEVFKQQQWHLIVLIPMLIFLYNFPFLYSETTTGSLWNISTISWGYIAVSVPIIHQVYVLLAWRLELYHKSISKTFGSNGFNMYKIGFAILIILRPISLIILAISNQNTFQLNSYVTIILMLLLALPSAYLFYSVKKYFGIDRAFGEDHFNVNKYKNQSLIKKGIFKYTNNGMYVYGFLALYIPGLFWHSKAALLIALFNHAYIWVHYYFTELPDIKKIYSN